MSNSVDERTKTPITWLFVIAFVAGGTVAGVAGAVLYVADIRSEGRITAVKQDSLEKRVDTLERDVKTELQKINDKLDKVIESRK